MVRTAGRYQRRRINALDHWWLRMLLGIKRRLTKRPKLTAIIQSRRLTLFGHTARIDNNTDAKRILLAFPPANWRRQPGNLSITWLSTVQQDLRHRHLMLLEAADLAQNRPLWRTMSTYGATYAILELHARNDDDEYHTVLHGSVRKNKRSK